MPKIAHAEARHDAAAAERSVAQLTEVARETNERGADAARGSLQLALTATGAAAEEQRDTARQAAEDSAELGRMFVDLIGEQTRHNLDAATAFGRAVNWADLAQTQREFIGGSIARMSQLHDGYRKIFQAGMKSMAFPGRH